ncbi:hypothetical protein CRG98_026382 [Punica granatum]|uniref:Uncharacterized protein n=1 Tax=Punica granatum TaxID=22663 RepID=A0A2I0JBE3_PUNGR|nr:hypothetical protein CRG98_026382 [Punica granatum]
MADDIVISTYSRTPPDSQSPQRPPPSTDNRTLHPLPFFPPQPILARCSPSPSQLPPSKPRDPTRFSSSPAAWLTPPPPTDVRASVRVTVSVSNQLGFPISSAEGRLSPSSQADGVLSSSKSVQVDDALDGFEERTTTQSPTAPHSRRIYYDERSPDSGCKIKYRPAGLLTWLL